MFLSQGGGAAVAYEEEDDTTYNLIYIARQLKSLYGSICYAAHILPYLCISLLILPFAKTIRNCSPIESLYMQNIS